MTEPKRPLKVFLCHAHADRDAVRALYTRLTNDGVDAWLDKAKLLPGQDWELEIRKAVRAADVVVVCLSKQFNQAGFRQKEVRLALDTAMEKPEGEIFIIPARLEDCDNLDSLRKWHWVDLFENDGYEMLTNALRARAERIGSTFQVKKGASVKAGVPSFKNHEGGATVKQKEPKTRHTLNKPNTAIVVALIGFLGTILVGLLNSPLIGSKASPTASSEAFVATETLTPSTISSSTPFIPSSTSTTQPELPDFWVSYHSNVYGNRDIFLLDPSTGASQGVITDPSHDKVGTWSPDGNFLAFESNRNSTTYYQIYLYDTQRGLTTRLTELADCNSWSPAWSPDGKKIAFYSNCEDGRRDIYLMNRDGTSIERLTSVDGENRFPAFSPDGKSITFTSTRTSMDFINIMNVDGSNQRIIVDGCSSTFSPDGIWLWFSSTCEDSDIKRIQVDGSNLSTVGTVLGTNPSVSPDGLFVIFESNADIWSMWVDGSHPVQLTSGSAVDGAPSWKSH